jgi:hypothetical protein
MFFKGSALICKILIIKESIMRNKIIILFSFGVILIWFAWIWNYLNSFEVSKERIAQIKSIDKDNQKFLRDNLHTNTAKNSIDLGLILDGGPWKDGIPSINDPKFIQINHTESQKWLNSNTLGISVIEWNKQKFYPYSVLYWHEIVNDIIWNKNISVTFCPLCGTAIVYNRKLNWEIREFWVSGKLYESNLLMYDNKNESLWSQSIWKAVVWDDLWKILEVVKSDVMSLTQFTENYPEWLVLSEDTWFTRNYARTPYGNYETEEDIYFPVQNTDSKLHQKELMFVLPYKWDSYAFVRSELMKLWEIEYNIWDEILKIEFKNWEITASTWNDTIPGYIEMWFSWVTQHPGNENVWIWE